MKSHKFPLALLAVCTCLYGCSGDSSATDELPHDAAIDTNADQSPADAGADAADSNTCSSPKLLCQGQCVDPKKDPTNCGTCGHACAAGDVCSAGKCNLVCSAGTEKCGSVCVNTKLDTNNCGTCGKICDSGQVCSAGKCDIVCSGGTEKCGNVCVDTKQDPSNCGTCGKICDSGQVCSAGKCDLVCSGGAEKCGSVCVDTKLDTNNCGACGKICGAGEVCSSGKCDLICSGGTEKCGNACIDTKTDPAHCGTCDTVCPSGETCVASKCEIVCSGGTSKCGTLCLNLQTEPKNCGKCGTVCEESAICDAGHCKIPFPVGMFCLPSFPDLVGFSETKDMVMGDFNQDNLADLVVNGRLALARGNGSFKSVTLSETLPYGAQSVVADLNGDGLSDLVTADDYFHRIGVALNKGDLSFQIAYYDVAVKPTSLTAGDLNGDGKPEVVFAAKNANVLGVMSNLGDGTLSVPKLSGIQGYPTAVFVGDIDGDKLNDVYCDGGALLKGDGKGGLTQLLSVGIAGSERAVSYDFDADGDLDVVGAGSGTVIFYRNDGKANFYQNSGDNYVPVSQTTGAPPYLAMADLNADGKMDLVVSESIYTTSSWPLIQLSALMNVGQGKFKQKDIYKDVIGSFVLGDITGDGKPELVGVGGGYNNATLQALRNKGDGSFAVPEDHPGHDFSGNTATADLDGDGKLDLAVANYETMEFLVYYNNGKGGFGDPLVFPTPTEASWVVTGDANSDGKPDVVIRGQTWASLYLNNGKGLNLPIPLSWFPSTMEATGELALVDLNGDGKRDIIATASILPDGKALPYVFLGNGDGTFLSFKKLSDLPVYDFGAADLNNDGRADFYANDLGTLRIWTSNADATLSLLGEYPELEFRTAADVDGDLLVDLVSAGSILYGKSDGTYERVDIMPSYFPGVDRPLGAVTIADMNQDGRPDLVVPDYMESSSVSVLLNHGGRKFSKEYRFRTKRGGGYSVNLIDINNDGALDLITDGGKSFQGMRFLLNGCGI